MTLSGACKQPFQKGEIQWDIILPVYQLHRNQISFTDVWVKGTTGQVLKEKISTMEPLWPEFPDSNSKISLIILFIP